MEKDSSFIFIERLVLDALRKKNCTLEELKTETGLEVGLVKEITYNLQQDGAVIRYPEDKYGLDLDFRHKYIGDFIEDVEDAALSMLTNRSYEPDEPDTYTFRKAVLTEEELEKIKYHEKQINDIISHAQLDRKRAEEPIKKQTLVLVSVASFKEMLNAFWGKSYR